MSLLTRSQLRFVAHAPWSAATAWLGVALGVASVVAVHLISSRVVESLDASAPPHLAGITHVLERPGLTADEYFDLRARWRRHPRSAVTAMVPIVDGYVSLHGRPVRVLGVDWLAMPSQAAATGQSLAVSDDVLVGEAVVADASLGATPGDTLTLGGRRFRVSAVRDTGLGAAVLADIAAAQVALGTGPGAVSRIGLAVDDPWRPWRRRLDRLMPGFGAGLPTPSAGDLASLAPGLAAAGGQWRAIPVAAERPTAQFARAVLFDLGALGSLALLVAWFLMYQVGVIWLRRQRLLMERLRAVGVSRAALRRSFVAVFSILGGLATATGIVAGVLLASVLTHFATRGVDVSAAGMPGFRSLDGWVVGKAVVSGLGVCLLGGLAAFAQESPSAAASAARRRARPWVASLLAAVIAVGILVERSGVLGGFLAIFAMSVAGVAVVSPGLALLRRVLAAPRGSVLTRLALRGMAWYPRMLGVALAALSLAVATSIGIALMVSSFRGDFERMLAVRLDGDLYVNVADAPAAAVTRWLVDRPAAARVTWSGSARARANGVPVELGYGRFDAAESARYGFPRPLRPGEALISERLARDLHLVPGGRLEMAKGELTVAGVFPGFGDPVGRVLVDAGSLAQLGIPRRVDRLTVTLGAGKGRIAGLRDELLTRFPSVSVQSRAQIRATALDVFDRTFAIARALTLLAMIVAVVGTYNALTALRLHQAPTAVLLRAQGVTRGEIRRMALWRALAVGGMAVGLAAPLGVAMAWILCAVINPRSFGWTVALHFPVTGWLPPLVLGMLAAVLAGALPAPRERGSAHETA